MAKGSQKAAAAAPALKPQGTKHKRTPQSFADGAAGKDVYEPEKIVAQRTAKGGVTQVGQRRHPRALALRRIQH